MEVTLSRTSSSRIGMGWYRDAHGMERIVGSLRLCEKRRDNVTDKVGGQKLC